MTDFEDLLIGQAIPMHNWEWPESRNAAGSTPWGTADTAMTFCRGITFYTTPGHGGFKVSKGMLKQMHPILVQDDGWYEEDCEASKVAVAFPQHFCTTAVEQSIASMKNWYPDEWAKFSGENVFVDESLTLRKRAFHKANADKWVVISAQQVDGMVLATATKGGLRQQYGGPRVPERKFLIPTDDYRDRHTFGFVIDNTDDYMEYGRETPQR